MTAELKMRIAKLGTVIVERRKTGSQSIGRSEGAMRSALARQGEGSRPRQTVGADERLEHAGAVASHRSGDDGLRAPTTYEPGELGTTALRVFVVKLKP